MTLMNTLRSWTEARTGWYIRRQAPWGVNKFQDMASIIAPADIHMVLDVGANVGQSAQEYLATYPNARIHSFEPVPSTFRQLTANVKDPRFTAHAIAFGSGAATVEMHVTNDPSRSDLSAVGRKHPYVAERDLHTEQVEMNTLDAWVSSQGIDRVDLLKVDTEGHDMEVLRGASGLLRDRRIRWAEAEVGIDPANDLHAPLHEVMVFMADHGYLPFGFYDQFLPSPKHRPVVRRSNIMFIAP